MDNPIGTTGNFGNLVEDYEQGRRAYPQALMDRVLNYVDAPEESLLLDVGCGTGISTRMLAEAARFVIGVDVDSGCIQKAQEVGGNNLAYRQASAGELPFRDATFDAVTTFSSFHWWWHVLGAMGSVHRVQRPNGCFAVINKQDGGVFRREARAIIAQYNGGVLSDAKKDYDPAQILRDAGLWNVEYQEMPHEEAFTLPQLLSQIRSLSAWNAVPENRRDEATEQLQTHFAERLENGMYRRPLVFQIVVARKTV